jgi:hypothetical protein
MLNILAFSGSEGHQHPASNSSDFFVEQLDTAHGRASASSISTQPRLSELKAQLLAKASGLNSPPF